MRGKTVRWAGGYVRAGVYVIRRKIRGRSFELSTQARTEAGALAQLARFEQDPAGYTPAPAAPAAVLLELELVRAFLEWSRTEKRNTAAWVGKQQSALAWWADELAGVDLRRASLRDQIAPALEGVPGWKHRARVLKAFYAWLRQEKHLLTLAEDPVAGQLRVPAPRPEQWTRSKVIPAEDLALVLRELDGVFRATVEVLAGTGWHVSEVLRFAAGGAVERERVLVCPRTKAGGAVKRLVAPRTVRAARELLELGPGSSLTHNTLIDELQRASAAAGVPTVLPGRFRHTFASHAIEHGAAPELVSSALDHRSKSTTERFYSTLAVRPLVPTARLPRRRK